VMARALANIDFREIIADFQNLNPRDVGAWPVAPRATVLVVLFVLILLAGWWFYWDDQLVSLREKQETELRLRDEFVRKKAQAINLDLYVQRLSDIDLAFGALLKQLPNKAEVESLLVEINQAGMGRGLQFDLFKPGPEQVRDFYAELPITVRLTGTYHDFGAFAGDIGKLSRIVTLNNISINTNQQSKDGRQSGDGCDDEDLPLPG